ncbi:MAG TPA: biopolymer transporter ExbD [Kofleriaceae bacterium]|nr:biopolymer transporter ExbD [Kofleriaceae bacterium]
MGMSTGGTRSINVTPLIDVLLVLLIIFMVLTPIVMKLEPIDLRTRDEGCEPAVPVVVELHGDGTVTIDREPAILAGELAGAVRRKMSPRDPVVILDSDDSVPWTDVIAALDTVRGVAGDDARVSVRLHDQR